MVDRAFGPAAGLAGAGFQSASTEARVDDRRFASILSKRAGVNATPQERAQTAAEEFVSSALVKPVLSLLRGSSRASAPFAPGAHEKLFAPLLDAELASRITRAQGFDLVDSVARQLQGRGGTLQAGTDGAGPSLAER